MATDPSRRRRSRGLRVRAYLLLLALVPLAGMGWVTVRDVERHRTMRVEAEAVERGVGEFVLLNELQALLAAENHEASSLAAIRAFGIPPVFAERLSGIDLVTSLAERRHAVDRLAAQFDLQDRIAQLGSFRLGQGSQVEVALAYAEVEAGLSELTRARFDELRANVGRIDGAALLDRLTVLEAATAARRANTEEMRSYYVARFSPTDLVDPMVRQLVAQRALYDEALRQVERLALPASAAATAMQTIRTSPHHAEFDAVIDAYLREVLPKGTTAVPSQLLAVAADLGVVTTMYRASNATAADHVTLVQAAGDDVRSASAALVRASTEDFERAIALAVALAAVSLAFVAAMAATLGRPLRQLATVARGIRDGVAAPVGRSRGPREVREATDALDEAAVQLRLAEQQALALARGDLDNELLRRPVAGAIGASLQYAVQTLASSLAEREEFRRRLAHESTHDGLTQLANRNASLAQLQRSLARTARTGGTLAVVIVDILGFKDVNDRHGHRAGDVLLRTVSQRLVGCVREGDHVGRLGGDEFVVIAEPVAGAAEAYGLASRLLAAVEEPVEVDGGRLSVGASAGIALAPVADLSADEILRDADIATFQAKRGGRGRVEFCSDELRAAVRTEADLETALRRAMERNELLLHYQPIATVASRQVEAFEALVRWNRPGRGQVPPDSFIPFAERSGLVVELDRWVLDAATRQLAAWTDDPWLGRCTVAVNVSGRTLLHPQFLARVAAALTATGVAPSRLVVEVTESALLDDLGSAAAKLEHLRSWGVRVAIDDFGTGYTSLAHLRTLPFDVLKIDRSFVADDEASMLVALVSDVGHLLGARVVAEGVETLEQVQRLQAMGVDKLQGWYVGRPTSAGDVGRFAPVPLSSST